MVCAFFDGGGVESSPVVFAYRFGVDGLKYLGMLPSVGGVCLQAERRGIISRVPYSVLDEWRGRVNLRACCCSCPHCYHLVSPIGRRIGRMSLPSSPCLGSPQYDRRSSSAKVLPLCFRSSDGGALLVGNTRGVVGSTEQSVGLAAYAVSSRAMVGTLGVRGTVASEVWRFILHLGGSCILLCHRSKVFPRPVY